MTDTCETCRFCAEVRVPGSDTISHHECHAHSPSMSEDGWGEWPPVRPDQWCGEHEPKAAVAVVVPPFRSITDTRELSEPFAIPPPCADCGAPFATLHKPDCPRLPPPVPFSGISG